jgi:NAD(P)-dependent dehydrogenase (short-subunit alcohol dehydrogenase family)
MAKIFITGSADGLGQLCAQRLIEQGHSVVLHARNAERQRVALEKTPGADDVLVGDLSSMEETIALANDVNKLGTFDAVIHNAGVYQTTGKQIFAVNTIAPYILTGLVQKPKRLIYLSSGMHLQGKPNLEHFNGDHNRLNYSDSKLHVIMLMLAGARRWPDVFSNAVDPGWVPTRMGGRNAPDDLQKGFETQTWLAVSNDKNTQASGRYFYHQKQRPYNPLADELDVQEKMLTLLASITGISFQNTR